MVVVVPCQRGGRGRPDVGVVGVGRVGDEDETALGVGCGRCDQEGGDGRKGSGEHVERVVAVILGSDERGVWVGTGIRLFDMDIGRTQRLELVRDSKKGRRSGNQCSVAIPNIGVDDSESTNATPSRGDG